METQTLPLPIDNERWRVISNTPDDDRGRDIGIDFGLLTQQLEHHEYPATNNEFAAQYGDSVLVLQNGEQTLQEVFDPILIGSFDSAKDARQAIPNCVAKDAIGRKGYSDRTPPALEEDTDHQDEPF